MAVKTIVWCMKHKEVCNCSTEQWLCPYYEPVDEERIGCVYGELWVGWEDSQGALTVIPWGDVEEEITN